MRFSKPCFPTLPLGGLREQVANAMVDIERTMAAAASGAVESLSVRRPRPMSDVPLKRFGA